MSDSRAKPERRPDWRWPLAAIVIASLLVGGALYALERGLDAAGEGAAAVGGAQRALVESAGAGALRLAESLRAGRITETFVSALPRLGEEGLRLEVASLEIPETLRRVDERRVFGELVPLGRTVAELRVPVTYRYHVPLDEPWQLVAEGGHLRVDAPALRPTLPPAIDTERLSTRTESGILRFDEQEQLETLTRAMTPTFSRYADDPRRVALVRDPARRAVALFVRDWLVDRDAWGPEAYRTISVRFADELPAGEELSALEGEARTPSEFPRDPVLVFEAPAR